MEGTPCGEPLEKERDRGDGDGGDRGDRGDRDGALEGDRLGLGAGLTDDDADGDGDGDDDGDGDGDGDDRGSIGSGRGGGGHGDGEAWRGGDGDGVSGVTITISALRRISRNRICIPSRVSSMDLFVIMPFTKHFLVNGTAIQIRTLVRDEVVRRRSTGRRPPFGFGFG